MDLIIDDRDLVRGMPYELALEMIHDSVPGLAPELILELVTYIILIIHFLIYLLRIHPR